MVKLDAITATMSRAKRKLVLAGSANTLPGAPAASLPAESPAAGSPAGQDPAGYSRDRGRSQGPTIASASSPAWPAEISSQWASRSATVRTSWSWSAVSGGPAAAS